MDAKLDSLISKIALNSVLQKSETRKVLEALVQKADEQFLSPKSEFIEFRAQLIRSGNVSLLSEILDWVCNQEQISSRTEICDIIDALKANIRWHQGKKIFQEERPTCTNKVAIALHELYRSYSLNTSGYVADALLKLGDVPKLNDDEFSLLGSYLGLNPKAVVLGWTFWNQGELFQPLGMTDEIIEAISFARDRNSDPRSVAFLSLSVGVYLLRFKNYSASREWLLLGLMASEKSDGVWKARIYSALAECELLFGDAEHAENLFNKALLGRSEHFGPSGWQLRLCEVAFHLEKPELGEEILREVLNWTKSHGEDLYYVWSVILLVKYELNEGSEDIRRAFTIAEARGMRRAVAAFFRFEPSFAPS